jgi:hypothetical protein
MSLFSRFFRRTPDALASVPRSAAAAAGEGAAQEAAAVAAAARAEAARATQAAADDEALAAAVAGHDSDSLRRLVLQGSSTRIRQQAAHAVHDPELLRQLIREVRGGKDNNVYRILTTTRDRLVAQSRSAQQLQSEIDAVVAALERHTHRTCDALFAPTLEQLGKRWQGVAAQADSSAAAAAAHSLECCQQIIRQHQQEQVAAEARALAEAAAAATERERRATETAAAAASAAEERRQLDERHRQQTELQEARAAALREAAALLRQAQAALQSGRTRRAATLREALAGRLNSMEALPPRLASQLQQLDERLQEIRDWKSFSVSPKRAQLLAEMQALIGASLEPVVLAERIADLRQQWRTLNRGAAEEADEGTDAERQQFQAAAEEAYQPCREHYAAEALVRKENLARRTALLGRLQAFSDAHDWQQPDWKLVSTALRESRQLWRSYSPVERAGSAAIEEQFRQLTGELHTRLEGEYGRNTERRQRLISQARELLALGDSREAIAAVKELQQQWKQVGVVPRATDHQLWDEFRQQCDAVFQKRQHEFAEYSAALEQNRLAAVALCEQLEALAAAADARLLQESGVPAELASRFAAAGEFPRQAARQLQQRFERAQESCAAAMRRARERLAESAWDVAFEAAGKLSAWRCAHAAQLSSDELALLHAAAGNVVASAVQLPPGFAARFRAELGRPGDPDTARNELALRELCVRAEIVTDRPTPASDLPLRRDYQMKRLVQGMGQGGTEPEGLDQLAFEWLGVGPVTTGVYPLLLERFRSCRTSGTTRAPQ